MFWVNGPMHTSYPKVPSSATSMPVYFPACLSVAVSFSQDRGMRLNSSMKVGGIRTRSMFVVHSENIWLRMLY